MSSDGYVITNLIHTELLAGDFEPCHLNKVRSKIPNSASGTILDLER